MLGHFFSPWVRNLGLHSVRMCKDGSVRAELDHCKHVCHAGGVISGQALFSAAESLMVCALASVPRITGTVQSSISFIKPATRTVGLHARVLREGRSLVFGAVDVHHVHPPELVAQATFVFGRAPEGDPGDEAKLTHALEQSVLAPQEEPWLIRNAL